MIRRHERGWDFEYADRHRSLKEIRNWLFCSYGDGLGSVYFLQKHDAPESAIKIGYSTNVAHRKLHIEHSLSDVYGYPFRSRILTQMRCASLLAEGYIHKAFDEFRLWREWFEPSPEIRQLIKEIDSEGDLILRTRSAPSPIKIAAQTILRASK